MVKRYFIIILLAVTCDQDTEIIVDPYAYSYTSKDNCPVEVWYNYEGVEFHRCYK